jgi:hypothetical protein
LSRNEDMYDDETTAMLCELLARRGIEPPCTDREISIGFAYQNLEASSSGSKVLGAMVELNLVSLMRGHAAAEDSPFVKQCNRDPGIS